MNDYPKSVIRRAEQILGYGITELEGERTYPIIDCIVYADVFTDQEVVIEGYTGTVVKAFNGKRNASEYWNELHLSKCRLKEVTLDLSWGDECFNEEIKGLLDWLVENGATDSLDSAGVKTKKIEDFSATYATAEETVVDINAILHDGFGYYIRRPFIIDVAREQKDGSRYF